MKQQRKTWQKKSRIGQPKTIHYQYGKCEKIPFLGEMKTGCLQFLCNISKHIKAIELFVTQM